VRAHDVDIFHPQPAAAAALAGALPERRCRVTSDPAALLARISDLEVLIAPSLPPGPWDTCKKLRLVHALGAGADGLLVVPPHVPIACARGLFAPEVAEHAWALILALERRLPLALEQQRGRLWRPYTSRSLAGLTLAVLGLGAVGRRVAHVGAALGLRVVGTRFRPEPVPGVERVLAPGGTAELLAGADIVVVALPLTPATRDLLDRRALSALRPGASLVVVGRAAVVDEAALVDLLRTGRIRGAALDVTADEPLPASSPLWTAPNMIVTPHVAGLGTEATPRLFALIRDNLARLDAGQPPRDVVDRERGY
jgi:phosphoglycerate dehydrogenase-like enzyme